MTSNHLLWHVFGYLWKNHKDVLDDMLQNFPDEKWNPQATFTLRQSLRERLDAFKTAAGMK